MANTDRIVTLFHLFHSGDEDDRINAGTEYFRETGKEMPSELEDAIKISRWRTRPTPVYHLSTQHGNTQAGA